MHSNDDGDVPMGMDEVVSGGGIRMRNRKTRFNIIIIKCECRTSKQAGDEQKPTTRTSFYYIFLAVPETDREQEHVLRMGGGIRRWWCCC